MLLAKLTGGPGSFSAHDGLEMATRGGAICLGRGGELGEISVGAVGDVVAWKLDGPAFAGVIHDWVEGWLRCGPFVAHHTVVAGRIVVENGQLISTRLDEMLADHLAISTRLQQPAR